MSDDHTQAPPHIQPPPPATPVPPPPGSSESQARTWNMFCHLSALAGYIGVPFGNVIGPLIVWQIKKNEIPSVDAHGKAALNFQITVLLAGVATGFAAFCGFFYLRRLAPASSVDPHRSGRTDFPHHRRRQGQQR